MTDTTRNDRFAKRPSSYVKRRAAAAGAAVGDGVAAALDVISRPRTWAVTALIAALFAFAGPFDTLERLSLGPRLGYWSAVMAVATPLAMMHVAMAVHLLPRRWPEALRAGFAAARSETTGKPVFRLEPLGR